MKTKLFRKYEADPGVFTTEDGTPAMDYFTPFGPIIARGTVPMALVERINAHADEVALHGHKGQLILPEEFVFSGGAESLAQTTADLIFRYVERAEGVKPERVRFQSFWIVSQYTLTASPMHFHSGDLSGVLYLRAPEVTEETVEESRSYFDNRQAGFLNFLHGGREQFAKSLISFKPQVGDFYIFPGWLLHGAEPFRGLGERRSLAFNAYLGGG